MLSLRPHARRGPRLRSKTALVNALRILWLLVVLWCELGAFFWSAARCRWPKQPGSTSFRVLLVADPQVPRPFKGWVPNLTWLKQYIVNHNLRKSWNAVRILRPQTVIFLGDMLRHGGKTKAMTEYADYFTHFQSIFYLGPAVPTYYVPGNRDVGLGSSRTFSAHARDRFEASFGPTNQLLTLGNHTLVLLDAPALVEEDYRRHGARAKFSDWLGIDGGSIDFVKSVAITYAHVSSGPHDHPVVLFSHIPLSRPDGASCGPLREHGNIRRGVGRGYQSLMGRETSKFLLEYTSPAVIFSADDHDYCEYLHPASAEDTDTSPVREVTVKSFSMATRLKRPGFQLLSLFSPSDSDLERTQPSYADVPCLLPNQTRIYTHAYAPLLFGSLVLLLFLSLRRPRPLHLNG
ncbi:Metallo-dependent phosphatase-like protein, partial [Gautieria morchelliformis]